MIPPKLTYFCITVRLTTIIPPKLTYFCITVELTTIIPPNLTYFCIHQEPQTLELLHSLVDHYPGLGKSVLLYIHLVILEI